MVEKVRPFVAEAERLVMIGINLARTLPEIGAASVERHRLALGDIGTEGGFNLDITLRKRDCERAESSGEIRIMRRARHSERPMRFIAPDAVGGTVSFAPVVVGLFRDTAGNRSGNGENCGQQNQFLHNSIIPQAGSLSSVQDYHHFCLSAIKPTTRSNSSHTDASGFLVRSDTTTVATKANAKPGANS